MTGSDTFYEYWRDEIVPTASTTSDKYIEGFTRYLSDGMLVDSPKFQLNINTIVSFFSNSITVDWKMSEQDWTDMIVFVTAKAETTAACGWWDYLENGFKYSDLP